MYCYNIVYRHTRGLSRGVLLKYAAASPVTIRNAQNIPFPTTLLARSVLLATELRSLLLVSGPLNGRH